MWIYFVGEDQYDIARIKDLKINSIKLPAFESPALFN
jgi:hypothetical protein